MGRRGESGGGVYEMEVFCKYAKKYVSERDVDSDRNIELFIDTNVQNVRD